MNGVSFLKTETDDGELHHRVEDIVGWSEEGDGETSGDLQGKKERKDESSFEREGRRRERRRAHGTSKLEETFHDVRMLDTTEERA